jgi:hypothetical protein
MTEASVGGQSLLDRHAQAVRVGGDDEALIAQISWREDRQACQGMAEPNNSVTRIYDAVCSRRMMS